MTHHAFLLSALLLTTALSGAASGSALQPLGKTQIKEPKQPVQEPQATPQVAKEDLPAASDVIAAYLKAIGGRESLERHSSRLVKGEVEDLLKSRSGAFELRSMSPDLMLMRVQFPEELQLAGYDGDQVWRIHPIIGPHLYGKPRAQAEPNLDYYTELHYAKHYPMMETVNRESFEGKECYKLRLVGAANNERFEYFETKTGLKRGVVTTQRSPQSTIVSTEIWSGWKEFEGVLTATRFITKLDRPDTKNQLSQIVTYSSVEFDTLSKDDLQMPADAKELLSENGAKKAAAGRAPQAPKVDDAHDHDQGDVAPIKPDMPKRDR